MTIWIEAKRRSVNAAGALGSQTAIGDVPASAHVVTACDVVHEELVAGPEWWHWSIANPVKAGHAAAFDSVVAELDLRVASVVHA